MAFKVSISTWTKMVLRLVLNPLPQDETIHKKTQEITKIKLENN